MKNANPVFRRGARALAFASAASLALGGCRKPANATESSGAAVANAAAPAVAAPGANAPDAPAKNYGYEVVHVWPHDRGAFTQGLVFYDGGLLESTGLNGESTLRQVELTTGRVLKQVTVAREYFAEGLAVLGEKAYQLTWQNHKGFVYDRDTFGRQGEFAYDGEGWGLATDGRELILSDGTAQIRFLDPATFAVRRTISVTHRGKPVAQLNELEWVKGEIYANVWQTDIIVRIDPQSGKVTGVIDFSGLLAPQDLDKNTDVLNGIAYDAAGERLFVTGKKWPKLFEVRLKAK